MATLLLAAAIADHVLEELDAIDHVHALQYRPSIVATAKHLRCREGRLVARAIRAFSEAENARAGLAAVFAIARPTRKPTPGGLSAVAELYGECLVAFDAVLGIWLRRHIGKEESAPVVELDDIEPTPAVLALQARIEAIMTPDEGDGLCTPLEDVRDYVKALARFAPSGGRRNGLALAACVLDAVASREPTSAQAEVIDRALGAALDEGGSVVRPLPARPWLSTAELGDVLGLGDRKTVVRWLEARGVPMQKPGKNITVLIADLERQAWGEWSAARKRYERGPVEGVSGIQADPT